MKKQLLYKILSHNVGETESSGALLASIVKKDSFIALYGDLGAGKTAFVRGFTKLLVPDAEVSSPSYTVVNEYENDKSRICHFDVYRITSDDDLYSVGYYDYEDCIKLVEWCVNTPQILPDSYYSVTIDKIDDNTRMIVIELICKDNYTKNENTRN